MKRIIGPCALAASLSVAMAACSEPAPGGASPPAAKAPPATAAATAAPNAAPTPAGPATPAIPASASPDAQAIDAAAFAETPADPAAAKRLMTRVQVLLDRAHFSPGVIDGQNGGNVRKAIAAFEKAHDLTVDGQLDAQVFAALTQGDAGPAMRDYVITQEDVAGPFVAKIPTDYAEMAKLKALAYSGPLELLAERFHMDETFLKALNPNADFTAAGTTIVVVATGDDKLPSSVERIEVDKAERQVRAYGAGDVLLAVYPATVGSSERPAPDGTWEVGAVAPNPTWSYDPARLTFGSRDKGKMTIAAGPNNPVGVMWIDLTKDTYGIHGGPDPRLIGKTASHGCVRLTNWDAAELGQAVTKGAKVEFVGKETAAAKKA